MLNKIKNKLFFALVPNDKIGVIIYKKPYVENNKNLNRLRTTRKKNL